MAFTLDSSGATVVVLGDSISAAYGLTKPEDGWVPLLQGEARKSGVNLDLVNASISGETSAGGLARVDEVLERHKPAILILELGANDGLRGLSPSVMQANLGQIIERAQTKKAKVLLLGMRIPPNYGKRFNDLFEGVFPTLAARYGIPYVPFLLEGVGGQAQLMQADGLHPNEMAQPMLKDAVWRGLQALL